MPFYCHLESLYSPMHTSICAMFDISANLSLLSTAVMSILFYIFLFLFCCSSFVFHFSNSSFLHTLFFLFLHWRYTTKVMVTLSALSNCFTIVIPIARGALPQFLIYFFTCHIMAGNTVVRKSISIKLFREKNLKGVITPF